MLGLWWSGAVILTLAGAFFSGERRVFEMGSFLSDSSAILSLALALVGLAQI